MCCCQCHSNNKNVHCVIVYYFSQVKGLSTEHGRLAAEQSQEQERRHQRNSSSATSPSALPLNTMKQECDSLMNPSSSGLSGGFAPYIPTMYRPFDATRKRNQRSPFSEPERQSVLRDGSRGSAENSGKRNRYAFKSQFDRNIFDEI